MRATIPMPELAKSGHSRRGEQDVCPVPGCDAPARPRKLCPHHWHYVPRNLQLALILVSRQAHRTARHDDVVRRVAEFAARAEAYIAGPGGPESRTAFDPPGTTHRDVRSSQWRPGRHMRWKAVCRAATTGESFTAAAWAIRAAILRRQETEIEAMRRENKATRAVRAQMRRERDAVYPMPESVRAILTGFETQRRRH